MVINLKAISYKKHLYCFKKPVSFKVERGYDGDEKYVSLTSNIIEEFIYAKNIIDALKHLSLSIHLIYKEYIRAKDKDLNRKALEYKYKMSKIITSIHLEV